VIRLPARNSLISSLAEPTDESTIERVRSANEGREEKTLAGAVVERRKARKLSLAFAACNEGGARLRSNVSGIATKCANSDTCGGILVRLWSLFRVSSECATMFYAFPKEQI
jgi:hypothetical protein